MNNKYTLSYWDSQIVASALISHCGVLASEDMQDGLIIGAMTIKNVIIPQDASPL
jgi:predicted nucleic acid-binding protein